jgi:hypothetical protein
VTFWDAWEKMCNKKTRTLEQPQPVPSSWQCAHPHIPENHTVCE